MGCKCQEKLCQRCYKAGDVHKCPTCRRVKVNPKVDRKWLRRKWKLGTSEACLGCGKHVVTRFLHKHETKCIKYRDVMDGWMEEDARLRRLQAEADRATVSEMETRLDLQNEVMDGMENQIDELESVVKQQEDERKSYSTEQTRLLRTLDSLTGPLYSSIRRLDTLYTKISSARAVLRSSTARHDARRRRAIEAATQVSVSRQEEEENETTLPYHPHPHSPPRQNLHRRLETHAAETDDGFESILADTSFH